MTRPQLPGRLELTLAAFERTERHLGLALGDRVRACLAIVNGAEPCMEGGSPEGACVCVTGAPEDLEDGHYFVGRFLDFGDADRYLERHAYYRDELSVPEWALLLSEGNEVSVFLDVRDLSIVLWSIIEGDFAYSYDDRLGIYMIPSLDDYLAMFHEHDEGADSP